jgi:4a-hydroxytetrahydrobiopterin dehydratase
MDLKQKKCVPCEGGVDPFGPDKINQYLQYLNPDWKVIDGKILRKEFKFKNFEETMKFVNKVAQIAQAEDHHPDMEVHYNRLVVMFSTHAIKGLSENDFIMAAKIDV